MQEMVTPYPGEIPAGAFPDSSLGATAVAPERATALQDLADAREARARLERLPRRAVTPGLNLLLWTLRLYVIGMTGALVVHAVLTL